MNAPREKKEPRESSIGRAFGSYYFECQSLRCARCIATIASLVAIALCCGPLPYLVFVAAVAYCYSTALPLGAHWERQALNIAVVQVLVLALALVLVLVAVLVVIVVVVVVVAVVVVMVVVIVGAIVVVVDSSSSY